MSLDFFETDELQWWSEVGFWETLRKEWEESGSDLSFEEWCEVHPNSF